MVRRILNVGAPSKTPFGKTSKASGAPSRSPTTRSLRWRKMVVLILSIVRELETTIFCKVLNIDRVTYI